MTRDDVLGFGKEFVKQFQDGDASGMSAELAYRWLFAVFPFGLFLAALGAFVASSMGMQNPGQQIVDALGDNLPTELAAGVQPELERVIGHQQPGLVSIGALLALWAATSGMMTVIKAMNRAYDVEETRSAVTRYGIGIGLTIAAALGLIVSFVTIVGGSLLTEQVANQLGLGATAWAVISIARWPVVLALLIVAVSAILRIGPNMTPSWRFTLVGGAVFAVGWLIATLAFALYISNFADYGATYGALAGVIVLMLWFYVTAIVLVASGGIVALLTKRFEPERIHERREAIRLDRDARSATAAAEKVGDTRGGLVAASVAAGAAASAAPAPTIDPARAPRPDPSPPSPLGERALVFAVALIGVVTAILTSRIPRGSRGTGLSAHGRHR
jgi:membrane protein